MGRNNNRGKSKNKSSLPQTPKNQTIAPHEVEQEFAQEIADIASTSTKSSLKK